MTTDLPASVLTLDDEELEDVAGGSFYLNGEGELFRYTGGRSDEDRGQAYLCPHCGRPLTFSPWLRYTCEVCDASWATRLELVPNFKSGLWEKPTAVGQ